MYFDNNMADFMIPGKNMVDFITGKKIHLMLVSHHQVLFGVFLFLLKHKLIRLMYSLVFLNFYLRINKNYSFLQQSTYIKTLYLWVSYSQGRMIIWDILIPTIPFIKYSGNILHPLNLGFEHFRNYYITNIKNSTPPFFSQPHSISETCEHKGIGSLLKHL